MYYFGIKSSISLIYEERHQCFPNDNGFSISVIALGRCVYPDFNSKSVREPSSITDICLLRSNQLNCMRKIYVFLPGNTTQPYKRRRRQSWHWCLTMMYYFHIVHIYNFKARRTSVWCFEMFWTWITFNLVNKTFWSSLW